MVSWKHGAARAVSDALPKPDRSSGGFVMSQQVDVILQQIERLDEGDRLLLEERLQGQAEAQWQQEPEQRQPDQREQQH